MAPKRHLAGIDGLRAVSVIAVVLYHLNLPFVPGGFLGVDVFFVISGFLITDLLIREKHENGTIDLRAFWRRRARRILPALCTVVLIATIVVSAIGGDFAAGLRKMVVASLIFVNNWWQQAQHLSYFAKFGQPQPLMHLWSLSIEEQFYVLWPLVLVVLLVVQRDRRDVAWIAGGGAIVSAVLMGAMFTPGADPSRVYFGTDTHAFGLLLGAALALWVGSDALGDLSGKAGHRVSVIGVVGLAGLVDLIVTMHEDAPWAFRGGIVVASVAAVLVIAAAATPGWFSAALGSEPLRWIGKRSYGIYLWHWPVIAVAKVLWPTIASTWPAQIAQAGVAVIAAAWSYRFVEQPVLRRGFGQCGKSLLTAMVRRRSTMAARLPPIALVGLVAAAIVGFISAPDHTALQSELASAQRSLKTQPTPTASCPCSTTRKHQRKSLTSIHGGDITAVGDSVMLADAPTLQRKFPGIYIDAEVSRSMVPVYGIISSLKSAGRLRDVVIIGVTDNGVNNTDQVEQVVDLAGKKRKIIFVDTPLRRGGLGDHFNGIVQKVVNRHKNTAVAHWSAYALSHPDQLAPDGVHPRTQSALDAYARSIKRAARSLDGRRPSDV